ncbi:MAG: type I DNA topoisomerase [Bacilli bacterium]|nr:type I DNA topoisomerase [Bacilli bacterium]
MKNLVIVESPSKSKTIEKYLGSDYKVMASMGHIRDLATSGKYGLGIDVDKDFKPNYISIARQKKNIANLKKYAKEAENIILATDPDREGEAISWHLKEVLGKHNYQRVTFNEITKNVVLDSINNPRDIDENLVKSQETRRFLDRIIGFRLSTGFVSRKTLGKHAGRVQSVALKLIVDREREIEAFVPKESWTVTAKFDGMDAQCEKYNGKKLELFTEDDANEVLSNLGDKFIVSNVEQKEKPKTGVMPFKTSTLQQTAINRLRFTSKKTMMLAQKLYEGVDIGSETVGLITYMRTDSERLSPVFINDAFKYIRETYGEEYVGAVKQQKKNDNMQDAHEGIRVTSPYRTPESIKKYLSADEYKLYSLIYARSLASLMANAKTLSTSITLDNNNYEFKATGSVLTFDGYLKIYGAYDSSEDTILPNLTGVESLISNEIVKEQHFSKPEPRYTESSLIKELEKLGIGRPSTYATIISTNIDADYVVSEDKKFVPTELGIEVTDVLQEGFSDIINVEYTANMEKELDEIAEGKVDNKSVLRAFYEKFESLISEALKNVVKTPAQETGEICPHCNSPMVIKKSKHGEFEACSNYPNCKYIKQDIDESLGTCPNCESPLVKKKGRYGEFVACSNYPNCKYIQQEEKEVVVIGKCPDCDGMIIEKKTKKGKIFYGCNNFPKCKFASWDKPEL